MSAKQIFQYLRYKYHQVTLYINAAFNVFTLTIKENLIFMSYTHVGFKLGIQRVNGYEDLLLEKLL